ncbi:MAG: hypothetical protein WD361_14965 [Gracilimonas sp.]
MSTSTISFDTYINKHQKAVVKVDAIAQDHPEIAQKLYAKLAINLIDTQRQLLLEGWAKSI